VKLRLTPRAVQDLAEIGDYIRERDPRAATRVRAAILESLHRLVLFPHIGRRQNVEGVRKLVTRRYPYLVYYTARADEVVILAVRHPARERDNSDD
jgi:toxin ParE1/3/4